MKLLMLLSLFALYLIVNHSPLKYLLSNCNNACIPVLAAFDRGTTYTLYNRRARAAASQSRQSAQTRRQRAESSLCSQSVSVVD